MSITSASRYATPFLVLALGGCTAQPVAKEPSTFGALPSTVTEAVPSWVPFRVRAGQPFASSPGESHFEDLRRITFDGRSSAPLWRADSRGLFYLSRSAEQPHCAALFLFDFEKSKPIRQTPADHCVSSAAIAKDHVLVSMSASAGKPCNAGDEDQCQLFALQGEQEPQALGKAGAAKHIAISSDGSRYTFVAQSVLFAASASADAEPQRIAEPVAAWVSFAPNGTALLWQAPRDQGAQLVLAGPRGQHPRPLGPFGQFDQQPVFLPDSQRIAFSSDYDSVKESQSRNWELYVLDPQAAARSTGLPPIERVSYHPARDGEPNFSADGVHLAFSSGRGSPDDAGASDIYVARWVE